MRGGEITEKKMDEINANKCQYPSIEDLADDFNVTVGDLNAINLTEENFNKDCQTVKQPKTYEEIMAGIQDKRMQKENAEEAEAARLSNLNKQTKLGSTFVATNNPLARGRGRGRGGSRRRRSRRGRRA
jgi:hypothetical protein